MPLCHIVRILVRWYFTGTANRIAVIYPAWKTPLDKLMKGSFVCRYKKTGIRTEPEIELVGDKLVWNPNRLGPYLVCSTVMHPNHTRLPVGRNGVNLFENVLVNGDAFYNLMRDL